MGIRAGGVASARDTWPGITHAQRSWRLPRESARYGHIHIHLHHTVGSSAALSLVS